MTYELDWYVPDQILQLRLMGQPALHQFQRLNQEIIQALDEAQNDLWLMVDVQGLSHMLPGWETIRTSQTYMYHPRLTFIVIVTDRRNRLVRLMMMILYNLSRAGLKIFDSWDDAARFLTRFSYSTSS